MKALALGVECETRVNNSMEVDANLSAQEVSDLLKKEFGTEFDDIFMIVNSNGCPVFVHVWQRLKHFDL